MPKKNTDAKLDVIVERVDNLKNWMGSEFTSIKEKQDKTNSRINTNERRLDNLEVWRGMLIGAIVIINVIVWPIIMKMWF